MTVPQQRHAQEHTTVVACTHDLVRAVVLAERVGWRVVCAVREASGVWLLLRGRSTPEALALGASAPAQRDVLRGVPG